MKSQLFCTKQWRGRFVVYKYFSNFLGTVPTFGFKILIVENDGSQNFKKNIIGSAINFKNPDTFLDDPCNY